VKNIIHVQYLGVVRLLINKKEDIYYFSGETTLKELITRIRGRYGLEIGKECEKQMIYLYLPCTEKVKQLKLPDDEDFVLVDGSLVKIVNMITGG